MNPIRSIVEALLGALLPAAGRHRGTGRHRACRGGADAPHPPTGDPDPDPAEILIARSPATSGPVARGEDIGVVRPYLVAFEREQRAAQRQGTKARRPTLWLAPHGVDLASLVQHDLRVAA